MSVTRRMTTRSSSRALSESSEPAETATSVQSAKSEPRRTRKSGKKIVSVPKETYSYGTDMPGTHSQQIAAQAAMMKPVRSIENGVEQAVRGAAGFERNLSDIAEDAQTGGRVFRYQVGGNLRGDRSDRSDSELTGMKTYGREDWVSLKSQSEGQSRAPSVDEDRAPSIDEERAPSIDDNWFDRPINSNPTSGSKWDSIRGSFLGILKSAGWLSLLIFPIAAIAISLYFIASWYPAMNSLQGSGFSGYNCSSTASECSPLAALEVERLGRRLDNLEDQFRKLTRTGESAARPPLRQINWLSYDLGARAIQPLSSPNEYFQKEKASVKPIRTVPKPRWWQFWGRRWWDFCGGPFEALEVVEKANTTVKFEKIDYGPNSALQPWRENEPRYCTPGKLQLAVKLPRPVTPRDLVMEYYLKDEVLAVGAAPQEVELWIHLSDDVTRAVVMHAVTQVYPDILAGDRSVRFREQNQALDSNWVPVGRWIYDIYANEIAQKFPVLVDLEAHGVAVDKIVIRVNSNWADRDVTCLVRARMHGIDQSGLHEQLDPRPDGRSRA